MELSHFQFQGQRRAPDFVELFAKGILALRVTTTETLSALESQDLLFYTIIMIVQRIRVQLLI